jgi:hypothetical protein
VSEYYLRKLRALSPRATKLPDGIEDGYGQCNKCGLWHQGTNSFVVLDDSGNAEPGSLCGLCAGVWSYLPQDETKGCLVPVIERLKVDPIWGGTKDAQRYPWVVDCARPDCFYHVAARTEDEGLTKEILHDCPHKNGPTKEGLMIPLRIALDAWSELDDIVKTLKEGTLDDDQKMRFRAKAQGMAAILAVVLPPPFKDDPEEISRESLRRYEGGPGYTTPGLEVIVRTAPSDPYDPARHLQTDQIEGIKKARGSGMFTDSQLADMWSVDIKVIQRCGK